MEMNGLFYLSAVSVAITSLVKVPLKRVQIQVKKESLTKKLYLFRASMPQQLLNRGRKVAFEDARLMAFF